MNINNHFNEVIKTLIILSLPQKKQIEIFGQNDINNYLRESFDLHYLPYKDEYLISSLIYQRQQEELDFIFHNILKSSLTMEELNKFSNQILVSFKKEHLELRTIIENEIFEDSKTIYQKENFELEERKIEKDKSLKMLLELVVVILILVTFELITTYYDRPENNDGFFYPGFGSFIITISIGIIYFLIWNIRILFKLAKIGDKKIRISYFLLLVVISIPLTVFFLNIMDFI